ncbi:MAG: ribbon-helix-helix domain-containing protein [Pseudomonadota bacterium]
MKKSEKVEIRVSVDEKQTLARLAYLEGTSVSELVRNLVRKYVAINTSSPTKRHSMFLSSAFLAAGALIGALIVGFSFNKNSGNHYFVEGMIEGSAFGFAYDLSSDHPQMLEINTTVTQNAVYRLEVTTSANQSPRINVCRIYGGDCISTARWDAELDPRWPSVFQTVGSMDESIFISIQRMAS